MKKETQLFWEGAEWVRDLIGQSEGEQALMVCANVEDTMSGNDRPVDFRRGAMAVARIAREHFGKTVQV